MRKIAAIKTKTEGRDKYPAPRYNGEIIETRKNLCEQFQLLGFPFEVALFYYTVMIAV